MQSSLEIKETDLHSVGFENNIENWMLENLPKKEYDRFTRKIPDMLQISRKTWYNYRKCKADVHLSNLIKLKILFDPWGCNLNDLIFTNKIIMNANVILSDTEQLPQLQFHSFFFNSKLCDRGSIKNALLRDLSGRLCDLSEQSDVRILLNKTGDEIIRVETSDKKAKFTIKLVSIPENSETDLAFLINLAKKLLIKLQIAITRQNHQKALNYIDVITNQLHEIGNEINRNEKQP